MNESSSEAAIAEITSPLESLKTIAVMEDKPAISAFLERRLRDRGFLVLLANSFKECENFASHGCMAFILDINMGEGREGEGLRALRALKERDRRIFCAVLTGMGDDETRTQARGYGCDAFLGKSFNALQDFDQVELALDRMLFSRAVHLPLSPAERPKASEICGRVISIQVAQSTEAAATTEMVLERKTLLIARHHELTILGMTSELTAEELAELKRVNSDLLEIQKSEAETLELSFAQTRAGQLESTLGEIERYIAELRQFGDKAR